MRADPDQKHEDLDSSSNGSSDVVTSQGRSSPVSNPLLTATLNAPPQSYYGGLNGNVRVKCPTDLSVTLTASKTKKNEESPSSDSHSQGLSSQQQPSSNQAVFYSTLLKQLRQKAGDTSSTVHQPGQQQIHVVPVKIKKEKPGVGSKSLPFMCPACKKRFQRHIAMNAHFQSEHISGPSSSGERSCKLCGSVSASLSQVRNHLRSSHNIDLDNPAKCLVEDPASFQTSKFSVLEASLRSGSSHDSESEPSCSNIDMSESSRSNSPLPAHHHHHHPSSSEQSPERSLFPLKQDQGRSCLQEDDNSQVEDLSVRKHVSSRGQSPVTRQSSFSPETRSPRPESPISCSKPAAAKRPRLQESPSPTLATSQPPSPPPLLARYTCTHCNISYPNQTLYLLHKGFHSDSNPWRCNGCGHQASDLYDFNSHLFSAAHQ